MRLRRDLVVFALLIVVGIAAPARGQDCDHKAKAAAALSLAKAQREREAVKAKAAPGTCYTDVAAATAEAARSGRALVGWVGLQCVDYPELRDALGDAIHCHLESVDGDATPRLMIADQNLRHWWVRKEKLRNPGLADKIKAMWQAVPGAPKPAEPVPVEISRAVGPAPIIWYAGPTGADCYGGT